MEIRVQTKRAKREIDYLKRNNIIRSPNHSNNSLKTRQMSCGKPIKNRAKPLRKSSHTDRSPCS